MQKYLEQVPFFTQQDRRHKTTTNRKSVKNWYIYIFYRLAVDQMYYSNTNYEPLPHYDVLSRQIRWFLCRQEMGVFINWERFFSGVVCICRFINPKFSTPKIVRALAQVNPYTTKFHFKKANAKNPPNKITNKHYCPQ